MLQTKCFIKKPSIRFGVGGGVGGWITISRDRQIFKIIMI